MTLLVPACQVTLSLLWAGLVGWAIARLFTRDLEPVEKLAWGFACGVLLRALIYAALLALGANPGPGKLLIIELFVLVGALMAKPDRSPTIPFRGRIATLQGLILGLACLSILVGAARLLSQPLWATDYLAVWGLKAKTIFYSGGIPRPLFDDPLTAWSHPEYPLLVPLSLASLAVSIGQFDDRAISLLYSAFQLATTLAVFGFLRRRVDDLAGAVAGLLTAAFIPLYQPSNAGTGDIPLAFGFVLLGTAYLDVLEADRPATRVRLLLAALFCLTTKQEGWLFVVLLAIALLLRSVRRREKFPLAAQFSLLAPLALQAAVMRISGTAFYRRDMDFTLLSHWYSWWPRILETLSYIAQVKLVAAVVPLVALLALFGATRRGPADGLLGPLIAQVVAYVVFMSLSASSVEWLIEASLGRLINALVPLVLLVAGARLGDRACLDASASIEGP
jgi:hypothetical protein